MGVHRVDQFPEGDVGDGAVLRLAPIDRLGRDAGVGGELLLAPTHADAKVAAVVRLGIHGYLMVRLLSRFVALYLAIRLRSSPVQWKFIPWLNVNSKQRSISYS